MHQGIDGGQYRPVLTWDEIDSYCFVYNGTTISFLEVTDPTPADIVITTYMDGVNVWAQGMPSTTLLDPLHPDQGSRINSAVIEYNSNAGTPMGYKALALNWDYLNTSGQPARSFPHSHAWDG